MCPVPFRSEFVPGLTFLFPKDFIDMPIYFADTRDRRQPRFAFVSPEDQAPEFSMPIRRASYATYYLV